MLVPSMSEHTTARWNLGFRFPCLVGYHVDSDASGSSPGHPGPIAVEGSSQAAFLGGAAVTDFAGEPKVLYVEDEPLMRRLISKALSREGIRVRSASNGLEGVELAGVWEPDLILMDLMMPVMSGYDAAQALKEHPRTSGIPVLAFTANANEATEARAREAGMVGVISKSCPHGELVRAVREHLGALRAR